MNKLIKQLSVFPVLLLCMLSVQGCRKQGPAPAEARLRGEITITGSYAMYPLVARWASEFTALHPGARVHVWPGSSKKGEIIALNGLADAGMYSMRHDSLGLMNLWFLPVAREPVVPVCNPAFPDVGELMAHGMSRQSFRDLWVDSGMAGEHAHAPSSGPALRCYSRVDISGAAQTWAAWLGTTQEFLRGLPVHGDPGVVEAIRRDIMGTGYCNLKYIYDVDTGLPLPAVMPLPIDLDGDGRIGPQEDFYGHLDSLCMAVSDQRFPPGLVRDLYFVFSQRPRDPLILEFLQWILTAGQSYIGQAGCFALDDQTAAQALDAITNLKNNSNEKESH